jgi:hypothetical protein
MSEPCPVVFTFHGDEYLGLIAQPAVGRGVNDSVAVASEGGSEWILRLKNPSPPRFGAQLSVQRQIGAFPRFQLLTTYYHADSAPFPLERGENLLLR